jgi:hypothetical protein
MDTWPFPDGRNTVIFTTLDVIKDGKPVLLVIHEQSDGAWQFHAGNTVSAADGRIAALEEIVFHDQSVIELADLPPGWIAVRDTSTSPWKRRPIVKEDGDAELAA